MKLPAQHERHPTASDSPALAASQEATPARGGYSPAADVDSGVSPSAANAATPVGPSGSAGSRLPPGKRQSVVWAMVTALREGIGDRDLIRVSLAYGGPSGVTAEDLEAVAAMTVREALEWPA